jgi:1-aminocyclopropane-1-carboxylate deaminase
MVIDPSIELISPILHPLLCEYGIQLDMLRLDLLHPAISGNKWFKLKYNIEYALEHNFTSLVSFGGAYSNHLHAMAYAGKEAGLKTIGYIRGEEVQNPTLMGCKDWGMKLHFVSRTDYKHKNELEFLETLQQMHPDAYIIPEGGSNSLGLKGCLEIVTVSDTSQYDHICCAVGTATTLTGIAQSLLPHQSAIGFTAMKNGSYLKDTISLTVNHHRWDLETEYHFGGFGKKNHSLVDFIHSFKLEQNIELDIVYTAKMMIGLLDLIQQHKFRSGSKILAIHTGGIQGNRSS